MADFDLNLLRVFDTLMELGSVTRAAGRLGVTQSAVSHSLGRLRLATGDPLFVRAASGLQPTARARDMAPEIREGLAQLRAALSPSQFVPGEAERRFTISAGSYFCALLIPDLVARAREIAPGVSFAVVSPGPNLVAMLDDGAVDLALGAFGHVPRRLVRDPLYSEELVWIASADNPLLGHPPRFADIAGSPRLLIASGAPYAGLGSYVSESGLERRVIAASSLGQQGDRDHEEAHALVHDASTAIAIVGRSNLVAFLPRRFAQRRAQSDRLVLIPPEQEVDALDMAMLSHSKLASDAGLSWLRDLVRSLSHGD
jgi:DNA-binding transcriptional LysR family regulator